MKFTSRHLVIAAALIVAASSLFMASNADAAIVCQSNADPSYRACFPGYTCPFGYFMVGYC